MTIKVLFISCFFSPHNTIGAVRTTRTAEKLLELGCDITVIAAEDLPFQKCLDTSFPRERIRYTKLIKLKKFLKLKSSKNFGNDNDNKSGRYKTLKAKIKSLIFPYIRKLIPFPDRFIGWYFYAMKAADQIIEINGKPDVILASASPYTSLIIGQSLSKKYSIPWVAELRDLWADNHYKPKGNFGAALERYTLKNASSIVTVSEPLADKLRTKYKQPVYTIYNAYDEKDYEPISRAKKNDLKKIVYTGSLHSGYQDPSPLFQALLSQPELKNKYHIHFYGSGMDELKKNVLSLSLEGQVSFHGSISRKKATLVQRQADILLFLPWNDRNQKGILTGKLFEYIGARRPILSIGEIVNDASEIITKNNFGFAVDTRDSVISLLGQYEIFENLQYDSSDFERTNQVKSLVRILSQAFEKTS